MDFLIVKWDNLYRYDYWWRQKYKVSFNSPQHRAMSQVDIAMEYFEDRIVHNEIVKSRNKEKRKERFEKTGQWLDGSRKNEELLSKVDWSQFNG